MVQNLRLVGSKTLTSVDSDVTANFTLTAHNGGTWCWDQNATCYNKSMVYYTGNVNYGSYYNWYAVTAGTGTYELATGDTSSSICPKGWRLPGSGGNGSFLALFGFYPSSGLMRGAPMFQLSGYRGDSNNYEQGIGGTYWTRSGYNNTNATYMGINVSVISPSAPNVKSYGFGARCLSR